MYHDPDDQCSSDQHNSQHWETGDGCQFPHIRRLLHRFTCWLYEKKTGTLNHCVTAESSLIYIFRVRFTLLHVLHEGVLGYCLHDAHGTQTSKSEFQNSELPHWPAHGNKTSQITIISYGSFTSSVRKQWVKAGHFFFNLFNIIIIEVIFTDWCNCCRNQPNFLN